MKKFIFLIFTAAISVSNYAQTPGSLDPSFGTEGVTFTSVPDWHLSSNSVKRNPANGNLYMLGEMTQSFTPAKSFLTKYNADGQQDLSFNGGSGRVEIFLEKKVLTHLI